MNPKKSFISGAVALACVIASSAVAQTTWTGAGDAVDWSNADNWSNGLPSSSNAVIFDSSTGATGLFEDYTVSSITFTGAAGSDLIIGVGGAAVTVNAGITNNTAATPDFQLVVSAGNANSTWNGPLKFSNIVNLGTRQITIVDSATFSGSAINIDINSATVYGRFLGAGVTNFQPGPDGIKINFGGSFTGFTAGQSFDFTTGTFTGATLGTLPTLSNGLSWDISQFSSQGILSVAIPEPSTWAALAGFLVLGVAAQRRRRVA
jgi:hypothetical protein